jgi:hypothetical protein
MENAHDTGDAYRKEVKKTIMAYREEIGKIIQAIPPRVLAKLADLRPNARDVVLSVIHDGRTFITGPVTPWHPHNDLSLPKTQQIDEPEALRHLDELQELLMALNRRRGSCTRTCRALEKVYYVSDQRHPFWQYRREAKTLHRLQELAASRFDDVVVRLLLWRELLRRDATPQLTFAMPP